MGGSCFGKDISALLATATEYNLKMHITEGIRTVNYQLRLNVVEKILNDLKILKGKTISLLGLAFKPNTDDIRDAPAIDIANHFLEHGAKVIVHDPIAIEKAKSLLANSEIIFEPILDNIFNNSDAIVLVTEWPEYQNLDWLKIKGQMRNPLILDGRNFLNRNELEKIGFKYKGIGR